MGCECGTLGALSLTALLCAAIAAVLEEVADASEHVTAGIEGPSLSPPPLQTIFHTRAGLDSPSVSAVPNTARGAMPGDVIPPRSIPRRHPAVP